MLREIEGNITNSEEQLSEKLQLENTVIYFLPSKYLFCLFCKDLVLIKLNSIIYI